jgi:TonB-linked SusC/RagA family outer membrane protein
MPFLLGTLIFSFALCAQRAVNGTVTDATGIPLIGVNVIVVSTSSGTVTDVDGNYSLTVSEGASLRFSYLGYETRTVAVGSQSQVDVTLREGANTFDEVVVIGYGTQEKRKVTSAISSVDGEELEFLPVAGLDQALQGQAPGVQVTKNTGAPGGGVSIRIRGTSSILSGQEPLYIIDGVPINNTFTGSTDIGGSQSGDGRGQAGNEVLNPLAGIPPEEIESIEILKDAASASIYGARAANGVIIVTTKRGEIGRPQITFSGYTGTARLPENVRYNLLDANQFVALVNEGRIRAGLAPIYDGAPANNTDWQDAVLRSAPVYNANFGIRGGTEDLRYSLSGGYFDQEGIMLNSDFQRFNAKVNLDFTPADNFKVGTNLLLSRSLANRLRNNGNASGGDAFNNNSVYGPSLLASALRANPTLAVRTDGENFTIDSLNFANNPVALANTQNLNSSTNRFIGNIFAEWEFLPRLTFRSSWGVDLRDEYTEYVYPPTPGIARAGSILNGSFNENLWLTENYLRYDVPLGQANELDVLVGFSRQTSTSRGFAAQIDEVGKQQLVSINSGSFNRLAPQGFQDYAIVSYYGRVQYGLLDRYLLSATVRRDGSSRFGPDSRFGTFPSASAGWILSEEPFLDNVGALSLLKLRASWGITGNDQLGDTWEWRGTGGPPADITGNYLGEPSLEPYTIDNRDFTWEETEQVDLGLEIGLFNNRIDLLVDYYVKTTENLLYRIELPYTTGFNSRIGNLGSMENRGWEFGLRTINVVTPRFRWSSNFNISFNRNKVLSLANDGADFAPGIGLSVARVGEPISYQGAIIDGIDPLDGDYIVRNIVDLPEEAPGTINRNDVVLLGSPLPDHFGGFTNTFSYGGFTLRAFLQWSYGNLINNVTRSFVTNTSVGANGTVPGNIAEEVFARRWTEPGDTDAQYRGIDINSQYDNVRGVPIDFFIEDGSYLRLKQITLSYQLPAAVLERIGVGTASVYVGGNNLLTWTNYSGYDPEVNHNNVGTNVAVGYDNGTYPNATTVTFGLNLSL